MPNATHFHTQSDAEPIPVVLNADFFVSPERLRQIAGRPPASVMAQFRKTVDAAARMTAQLTLQHWYRSLAKAQGALAEAASRLQEVQCRYDAAVVALAAAPVINWFMLLIWSIVAPVAVSAEVAMTFFVLPGLLNIPPKSALGVAVGCTPLVATVAVKHALDWLFETAAAGLSRPEKWPRRLALGLDSFLRVGLLALNLTMLIRLVLGREEAMRMMGALLDLSNLNTMPHPDQKVIHSLLLWVGVVAVLDSALVLGNLTKCLHQRGQRREARREVLDLRREVDAARKVVTDAKAAEDIARHLWDGHEQSMPVIEDAFRQRNLELIAEIEGREVAAQPALTQAQWISQILAPRAGSVSPAHTIQ